VVLTDQPAAWFSAGEPVARSRAQGDDRGRVAGSGWREAL